MKRSLPALLLTAGLSVTPGLALSAGPAGQPPAQDAFAVPPEIRDAGWKEIPQSRAGAQDLDAFAYRVGSWISENWRGEGDERHRIRIVYERRLGGHALRARSFRVFEDGSEDLYLEEWLFKHGTRDAVVAHLYFDETFNGLFADAVWIVDESGYERLDCDLVSPEGGVGQVRDFFRPVGDDRILWTSYSIHEGEVSDPEPANRITLIRER